MNGNSVLIKLISNKQAKWLTYRISWCNVRIKLGQSLWAWRAFAKCLPLLNRQRREVSMMRKMGVKDHWGGLSTVVRMLHWEVLYLHWAVLDLETTITHKKNLSISIWYCCATKFIVRLSIFLHFIMKIQVHSQLGNYVGVCQRKSYKLKNWLAKYCRDSISATCLWL